MTATISQTRRDLIGVAQQLFARKGVENTTMNDIAEASQRGRRTLYTYFSSKYDIYKAVLESELNMLYSKLEEVVTRDIPADEKLIFSGISGKWRTYAKNSTGKRFIILKEYCRTDATRGSFN